MPAEGTLYLFRWQGRVVFLRLSVNGGGRPRCPRLFDEVVEIPVVAAGEPPPARRTRVVPMVADWLADLAEGV